jgi:Bax protein
LLRPNGLTRRRAVLFGAPLAVAAAAALWWWWAGDGRFAPRLPPAVHLDGYDSDLLRRTFLRLGYDLDAVSAGREGVPRVILASLPPDLGDLAVPQSRKELFVATMLPLVLQVNEEIAAERRRLLDLQARMKSGEAPSRADLGWLEEMAEYYAAAEPDPALLLPRIDQIPASLALAQAAEESGWGTSRFARDGNALFGQWSFDDDAMRPKQARSAGYGVRAFDSLLDAVRAYARNLNGHPAYRDFRRARAEARRAGRPLDGNALAGTLTRYSERGPAYVRTLRSIIRANGLTAYDAARFAGLS